MASLLPAPYVCSPQAALTVHYAWDALFTASLLPSPHVCSLTSGCQAPRVQRTPWTWTLTLAQPLRDARCVSSSRAAEAARGRWAPGRAPPRRRWGGRPANHARRNCCSWMGQGSGMKRYVLWAYGVACVICVELCISKAHVLAGGALLQLDGQEAAGAGSTC